MFLKGVVYSVAYYSFYKIIKDILFTIFGKKLKNYLKFLFIFLFFAFVFLFFNDKKVLAADFTYGSQIQNGNYTDLEFTIDYSGKTVDFEYHILNSFVPSNTKQTVIYPRFGTTRNYIDLVFSYSTLRLDDNNQYWLNYINTNDNYWEYKRFELPTLSDLSNKIVFWANSNSNFTSTNWSRNYISYVDASVNNLVYSSLDIYNNNNELVFSSPYNTPPRRVPAISTSLEDLETLNFDVLSIDGWNYSNEDFYLLVYDRNYSETESYNNLYPKKEILLNGDSPFYVSELSADPSVNKIFWVPIGELGLEWKIDGTYGFRFAIREPIESEFSEWAYSYLDDELQFTVDSNVAPSVISSFNNATQQTNNNNDFNELNDNIKSQTQQNNEFYNNILSNSYDDGQIDDTLGNISESSTNFDDSQYTGLFTAIFGRFSNIINGNYNEIEHLSYPIPNTEQSIVISSDLLYSKIQGTFIYTLLQVFWMYLFGMYTFKFSYNLIIKIKDGSILNGYENNNEVITSNMM